MGGSDERTTMRPRRVWHNPNFTLGTLLSGVLAAIMGIVWLVDIKGTSDTRWDVYQAHREADKALDDRAERDLNRRLVAIETALNKMRYRSLTGNRGAPSPFPTSAGSEAFSPTVNGRDFDK